nr:receptor-like serine/threonine-protein kinase ALE2 isoform X2 [Tanacetum cinerariifolium]
MLRSPVAGPTDGSNPLHHHYHRHHHHHRYYHHRHPHRTRIPAISPSASPDCGMKCMEPLASAPMGSPCRCIIPMKVRILLQVSVYTVFPFVNELKIELAAGTYLTQRQVVIVGASADKLTYNRFWRKRFSLDEDLFGDYDVVYIIYPGLPISLEPPVSGPNRDRRKQFDPVAADSVSGHQKMSCIAIFVIAFSTVVFFIVCCAAISIFLKCTQICSSSNAVGRAFTSPTNMMCGLGALISRDSATSTSVSVISSTPSVLKVKTFSLAKIEKATEKFSSRRVLGVGGFGRVYHGIMEDGAEVAVKLLHRDNNQNGDHEFIEEVVMLSRLHHINLVKLIGICIEKHTRCLIYELVPNGNVESHLHGADKQKGPLDWDTRLKIALGAARGLAYLHEDANPHVIHRDFKAGNVLLKDDFTPKVSDFGLAREATEGTQHISTRVMGTFGYVAPEYAMTGHLLVKSDVYSYGVVLLELLSGRKPVDMSRAQGEENLATWARLLLTTQEGLHKLIDPTLAETCDFNDMAKVAAIASMCVHPEVDQRPFMGEVVQALKLIYCKDDTTTQRDSSAVESDIKGDSGWWNTRGPDSPFITMDYSSGSLNELEKQQFSGLNFNGVSRLGNRSGPLMTARDKAEFYRLKGNISEHVILILQELNVSSLENKSLSCSCKSVKTEGLKDRCNAVVLTWIINSVSTDVYMGLIYSDDAATAWKDLESTYDKVDSSIIFNLLQKISCIKQGGSSLADYYHRLNSLWREFDSLSKLPTFVCDANKELDKLMKLMQFLMGLDECYLSVKSSLLTMDPLPEVKDAYVIVSREESHRGFPKSSSVTEAKLNAISFAAKSSNNFKRSNNNGFKKVANPIKQTGFKQNYNANVDMTSNDKQQSAVSQKSSSSFTPDQMKKLLSLINENSSGSIHANMAVSTVSMSNVVDISNLKITLRHPNGTLATFSHVRNLQLTKNVMLYDVRVILGYCVSLLSVNKMIKDSKLFVSFDEDKCYNQDLKREIILSNGSESSSLYLFDLQSNKNIVLAVLKNGLNLSKVTNVSACEVCLRAKQTRETFPLSDHKSEKLGDLVHLDL